MQESLLLVAAMVAIVVVAIVAKRFELPYPIAFVIGGSALAFVPHLPHIRPESDLIFLIFLPPLLYSGGWLTDWKMFLQNLRPIGLLAIGLVIVTTAVVGIVFHALFPSLGWGVAFTLGAIVSPPDAVAAGAVFERFSVPPRMAAILDGEGLLNDAIALVIYRFAVAAVLTKSFSAFSASLSFVGVSVGGLIVGVAAGWLIVKLITLLRKFELSDSLIDNSIQLIAPYAIYMTGDLVHASGVLATVAAGVYMSRQAGRIHEPEGRLVAYAVWQVLIFLLNGVVFLLIGLQLRPIVVDPTFAIKELWIGLAISGVVIVTRLLWVYPATYVPCLFMSAEHRRSAPSWRYVFVIGWSGMRGIVSLASALALPEILPDGSPFPGRDTILFVTFCVIFVTLVVQGLSLIPILRILRIDTDVDLDAREIEVRVAALEAGVSRLRSLEPTFETTDAWSVEGRILGEYEYRIAHLSGHLDGSIERGEIAMDHILQEQALEAERAEILRLRDEGEIPDEIYRRIQYDLDLASERLS